MSKYNLLDIYEQYQIGSGWTKDFDYDGMLKAGLSVDVDMDIETMKKIVEDFTDVNYHREASHLYDAIEALEAGNVAEANGRISDFHIEIKRTMKDQGMDMSDDLGAYMASKMEEEMAVFSSEEEEDKYIEKRVKRGLEKEKERAAKKKKEVKEVTSREGSRMEGLVDQRMKAKFLEIFADLYFDLTDEDPFQAEDVVDYLGIEMLKHLDAIQADGDKKAGIRENLDDLNDDEYDDGPDGKFVGELDNTLNVDKVASPDAKAHDYGAEIKGISDEDDTEEKYAHGMVLPLEEMFGPVKFLKSKGIDDDVIADFMKVHAKDIVGASEDEIMDEFENFRSVNYDYIDENLKSHFKRFI